ncbi:MAG: HlyD family type I secretion periplasmic adaptor subunit [Nitrosomonadales bacterium]|nr:HlyD family type I secretion periplasmic adaptor subunit [Nitrosomonadales bacterium]
MKLRIPSLQADAYDFAPDILRLQHQPPSPMPRAVLLGLLALFFCLLLWAALGRLDIIAVAQGKLVPQSALKIVQPADSGIVEKILVREGDEVRAGQVLVRMDAQFSEADNRMLAAQLHQRGLQLRRIDAELGAAPLKRLAQDPPELYAQIEAQHRANRLAYRDALDGELALRDKAEQDLKSALEIESKLTQTVPIYREQDQVYEKLAREGFASRLMALEKSRDHIEKEQELRSQAYNVASLRSGINQSEKRIAQITSNYHQQLQNERVEAEGEYRKLKQEWEKQAHRHDLLELKAPQDGIIKDLSTHTPGTVVQPGAILMTVVPKNDLIEAEVWVTHLDAGFVEAGQTAKVKLAAYPFQKYGMVGGEVKQVSPDAADAPPGKAGQPDAQQPGYRATVALAAPFLESEGRRHRLSPGMQVSAEINLGNRSVLEYLLSPIRKTAHEAGRER